MKARGILLVFWTVSAAMRAEAQSPDWFDAFRGKAYLQGDASFVAREKAAAPDSPPLFRARWVVVRFEAFSGKARNAWPYRNLLLMTMPGGARYVVESAFGFVDENHLEEDRPFHRVASAHAVFEMWSSGGFEDSDAAAEDPCGGSRQKVRAPGGSLDFILTDLSSRTVRTSLREITAATFDANEHHDLVNLLKVAPDGAPSLPKDTFGLNARNAIFSVTVAFRDDVPPVAQRTVVLTQDPEPSGDLAAWRGLAHLPLDLPPFPAIVPENPIR
ncbi:MAG: hypothetical protein IPL89_03760 [Acidobacteria bacterium]|nr:hypothetical protein [Acidobacteriota bacterium]